MPEDVQRKISCHDLKRTVDNYNGGLGGPIRSFEQFFTDAPEKLKAAGQDQHPGITGGGSMTDSMMVTEWFLIRLGALRSAELVKENKLAERATRKADAKTERISRPLFRRFEQDPTSILTGRKNDASVSHPGITADAAALGCNRVHLWFVITGQRTSKRLSARYQALKASQKGGRP